MPTVSIELEEDWNSSLPINRHKSTWNDGTTEKKFKDYADSREQSTEVDDFTVEVETSDGTKPWKPQLVFPNKEKTNPRDDKSVVMRVGKKKPNYLSEVELAPFIDGKFYDYKY